MSTVVHHNFGGTTALVLVGERLPAKQDLAKRTTARRGPGIAERIECLKKGAASCRELAANAGSKTLRRRFIEHAEKWERRAERLADKVRGRQQTGELFAASL